MNTSSHINSKNCMRPDYIELFQHLQSLKFSTDNEITALCPFHDDHNPSFTANTETGLWKCYGCGEQGNAKQFAQRTGQSNPNERTTSSLTHVADYEYKDEVGNVLYVVKRFIDDRGAKTFRQFRMENGRLISGIGNARRVPYNLPSVIKSDTVFIAEGEKDCHTLMAWELIATTNSGGAEKWQYEFSEFLRGKTIYIVPDNDAAGERHRDKLTTSLQGKAKELFIIKIPAGKDVTEWRDKTKATQEDFQKLITQAISIKDLVLPKGNNIFFSSPAWPVLENDALHGLSGQIVEDISPFSEADPAALLINLIVGFGNSVGRCPYFLVEQTEHHLNLFAVLVGNTAVGRKGTSWSIPSALLSTADNEWASHCLASGLTSGEGLIHRIRDQVIKIENGAEKIIDDGVKDKRLLVVESEFSSALKNASRQNAILSEILRNAWDGATLSPLVRNNPYKATKPHISVIGHITRAELERCISETDLSNGFANRFLWILVKRSKSLPNSKGISDVTRAFQGGEIKQRIEFGRRVGLMQRDDDAEELWAQIYEQLTNIPDTRAGNVLARGAPIVMRLACIYALMDLTNSVGSSHIKAAIALWNYCKQSANLIFGEGLSDDVADNLLHILRMSDAPLSTTDFHRFTGRHIKAGRLQRALEYLEAMQLIRKIQTPSAGRTKTEWSAI